MDILNIGIISLHDLRKEVQQDDKKYKEDTKR